ncbi:hypothetical protein GCM10023210_31450 [Chryseobacterium ginsengisoli]|uniref:Uncharacterized protein n=1 Tax=Chryseobacterium ginsengisoli TaxID=363853 RepID=A0ABP9MJ68_9FLAO
MKKTFFLSAFIVAGLVSAKNVDVKKDKEGEKTEKKASETQQEDPTGRMQCTQVGMLVWCTNEVVADTVCWGEGSGTSTYQQAMLDEVHNSQLLTEYFCGLGTGSGPNNGGN